MAAGDLNVLTGKYNVRICYADAHEDAKDTKFSRSGASLKGDATISGAVLTQPDPRKLPIVFKTEQALGKDSKILIEINDDTADVFDNADNIAEDILSLPVTILNTETGKARPQVLTARDMDSGADVTLVADEWTTVFKYTAKAQERIKIGMNPAEDSKMFFCPLIADATS